MSISPTGFCVICQEAILRGEQATSHIADTSGRLRSSSAALQPAGPQPEHTFHSRCLEPWLAVSNTCPICQKVNAFGLNMLHVMPHRDRGQMMLDLARAGDHENLEQLLNHGEVNEFSKSCAVLAACMSEEPSLACIESILNHGPILDEFRGWALSNIADKGDAAIARALLNSGHVSSAWRSLSLEHAVREGHVGVVKALIASRPLTLEQRASTIKKAYQRGHYHIIAELTYVKPLILVASALATCAFFQIISYKEESNK